MRHSCDSSYFFLSLRILSSAFPLILPQQGMTWKTRQKNQQSLSCVSYLSTRRGMRGSRFIVRWSFARRAAVAFGWYQFVVRFIERHLMATRHRLAWPLRMAVALLASGCFYAVPARNFSSTVVTYTRCIHTRESLGATTKWHQAQWGRTKRSRENERRVSSGTPHFVYTPMTPTGFLFHSYWTQQPPVICHAFWLFADFISTIFLCLSSCLGHFTSSYSPPRYIVLRVRRPAEWARSTSVQKNDHPQEALQKICSSPRMAIKLLCSFLVSDIVNIKFKFVNKGL